MIRLQAASSEAAIVMLEVIHNAEVPASIRLRAAQAVLDACLKWTEFDDLASRLEALEGRLVTRQALAHSHLRASVIAQVPASLICLECMRVVPIVRFQMRELGCLD